MNSVEFIFSVNWVKSIIYLFCFNRCRSSNTGLLAEKHLLLKYQIPFATGLEFSLRTLSLLDPNSGMKWNVKTRLESAKDRLFKSVRFSSARPKLLKTTVSSSSIFQEPVLLTCTRSTEQTLSAELFHRCTTKWQVDIVPELSQSILSRQSSSQTNPLGALRSSSTPRSDWDSLNSPPWREPQQLPTRPRSLPRDPPSYEEPHKN